MNRTLPYTFIILFSILSISSSSTEAFSKEETLNNHSALDKVSTSMDAGKYQSAAEEEYEHVLFFPITPLIGPPKWIGPGGGNIPAIAIDPTNANILYAGSWGSGVFKSTSGGETWFPINFGLDNLFINALAIDPQNPQTLYAGTYKSKLYKTTNGGQTWFFSSDGIRAEAIIYAIAIDPQIPSRIYISTRGKSNNGGPPWNGVIYRSTNSGASWDARIDDIGGVGQADWAYAMTVHPNDSDIVFAATHEYGAYRSDDHGKSWEAINEGVTDLSGRTIDVNPQTHTPATVYMGVFRKEGLFKSTNGGDSWRLKDNNIGAAQIFRMAIDPQQTSKLYLGTFTDGLMRSTDAGDTWFSAGLPDDQITAIAIHPDNSQILYVGTYGNGLFKTTNGSSNWAHSHYGLWNTTVTSLIVHPDDSRVLYASIYGGYVSKTSDQGQSWMIFKGNLNDRYINALILNPAENTIFALTDSSGLYKCELTENNCWEKTGDTLPNRKSLALNFSEIHPYAVPQGLLDPPFDLEARSPTDNAPLMSMGFALSSSNIAYIGTAGEGVYKSIDNGDTWTPAGLSGKTVRDLCVSPIDANIVYATTDQVDKIMFTDNGGGSWSDSNLPGVTAKALSISPLSPDKLFAGTDSGVYIKNGADWSFGGLSGHDVTAILAHPSVANVIYAGTTNGAFISTNGGSTWNSGLEELNRYVILSIDIDPRNPNLIYFSTSTHGVLRIND